jgi:hypothetical protein
MDIPRIVGAGLVVSGLVNITSTTLLLILSAIHAGIVDACWFIAKRFIKK